MKRLDRQSFLGCNSDEVLDAATVGLVGLGGGGSHHGQQLAHFGIGGFVLVDPDTIDLNNTNRLIGGTQLDVDANLAKVEIAARLIRGIHPGARVKALKSDWRFVLDDLKACYVLVGAVDSFRDRDQLERFSRRFMIPYVDVGMDLLELPDSQFLISGQVIVSMPRAFPLGAFNINMNPLMVARHIGELINLFLRHLDRLAPGTKLVARF